MRRTSFNASEESRLRGHSSSQCSAISSKTYSGTWSSWPPRIRSRRVVEARVEATEVLELPRKRLAGHLAPSDLRMPLHLLVEGVRDAQGQVCHRGYKCSHIVKCFHISRQNRVRIPPRPSGLPEPRISAHEMRFTTSPAGPRPPPATVQLRELRRAPCGRPHMSREPLCTASPTAENVPTRLRWTLLAVLVAALVLVSGATVVFWFATRE